jgi:hypothetical protein
MMKKFSQLRHRIYEQEITLPKDGVNTVKVEINADGTQQQQPQDQKQAQDQETTQDQQQGQSSGGGDVVKFFSKIFESREMAHVYHLTVKGEQGSHAKHLALGEYYDKIIGMLDELIEVYQGEYEVIEGYDAIDTSSAKSTDAIEYFKSLAGFVRSERTKCFKEEETHYHNIIDDILVLIYKTLYKLKYNK